MNKSTKEAQNKISEYLKTHTREGDCPCAVHQKHIRTMSREILKLLKDMRYKRAMLSYPSMDDIYEEIDIE